MKSLTEDTIGDKVVRFVLGAVLGCAVGFFLGLWSSLVDAEDVGRLTAAAAIVGGVLAVLFGNAFLEWVLRGRWWSDWWD